MLRIPISDDDLEIAYTNELCPVSYAISILLKVPLSLISIDMYGIVRINNSKYAICDVGIDFIDDWENGKFVTQKVIKLESVG